MIDQREFNKQVQIYEIFSIKHSEVELLLP